MISKLPINQLNIDLNEIKKGLGNLKKAITFQTNNPDDKIKEVLGPYDEKVT